LNNEYPQVGGSYEVVHHTQLLNRLVRTKQLVPVASVSQNVTYHAPCYLGRHNKVYNAPRELMEASGSNLVEMPRHGERSMCCGAGGARMWMEEQLGKRINIDRVDEALTTNPAKIATGCPFCRVMLTDGVTARQEDGKGEGVEVVDVAQLMLDAIERVEPAKLTENLTVIQEPKAEPEPEPQPEPEAEPEPVAEATPAAAKAAPAGGGLAMKGPAKAPGKGLGMKGAAKAPGAKASAPAETEAAAAPAKGLGMKGAAKAPGGKGLAMKGAAKAAAPAEAAPAAEAPGETAAASTETASAPAGSMQTVAPKGLAMKSGFKRPGPKAPGAKAPAAASAESAPADAAPASSESASAPAESAPAQADTASAATATKSTESETQAPANGNGATQAPLPTAKPGGLGFKTGAKAPGGRSLAG
ncbi:(Fe-S)-binding protein, partial [Nocardia cyriacigeorgica]